MAGIPHDRFEMSHAEIADRLGLTPRVVWRAEKRALRKLRERLEAIADELFAEPERLIRQGRRNRKKIVRVG